MENNYIKVTTYQQAKYHMDKGEILVSPVGAFRTLCARRCEDNKYEVAYVPIIGRSVIYEGSEDSMHQLCNEYEFFVIPGAELKELEPPMLWKLLNRLHKFFGGGR
jgi:hypothetical protein